MIDTFKTVCALGGGLVGGTAFFLLLTAFCSRPTDPGSTVEGNGWGTSKAGFWRACTVLIWIGVAVAVVGALLWVGAWTA